MSRMTNHMCLEMFFIVRVVVIPDYVELVLLVTHVLSG